MATVEFDELREFLTELSRDSKHVDRRIVRVAQQRRASAMSTAVLVSVVGTARVGKDIYRVEDVSGAFCGIEEADRRVVARLNKQLQSLRKRCRGLGFDVRSGVLEESAS